MITFDISGDFKNTIDFLDRLKRNDHLKIINQLAKKGTLALMSNTPKRSGKTASAWTYEVIQNGDGISIHWKNTNVVNGVPIAIILQYGHGTGTGGYVSGYDYINPALKPIFDEISDKVWKAVTKK